MVKLSPQEIAATRNHPRQWYLPHHPVVNPNKPGKVRRVLNGASVFRGTSLNIALLTGPDLLRSLVGILLRFRRFAFAISADIEGMFLQVGVPEKEQPCLRFLWVEEASTVETYQYTRHVFGAKDSPTCANYALRRTALDNKQEFPRAHEVVLNDFYMDDLLHSLESSEDALTLGRQLKELVLKGGFKLVKWLSNDAEVAKKLNELDSSATEAPQTTVAVLASQHAAHVLGLKWDVAN